MDYILEIRPRSQYILQSGANVVEPRGPDLDVHEMKTLCVESPPLTHPYQPHGTDLIEIGFIYS